MLPLLMRLCLQWLLMLMRLSWQWLVLLLLLLLVLSMHQLLLVLLSLCPGVSKATEGTMGRHRGHEPTAYT
jgi:hypothetical protein